MIHFKDHTSGEREKQNCHIFFLNVSWQRTRCSCSDRFAEYNACRKHWTTNVSFRWCCKWHLHVCLSSRYSQQLICLGHRFHSGIHTTYTNKPQPHKWQQGFFCTVNREPRWPYAVFHQGNMHQRDTWPYLPESVILILSVMCGYLYHCREQHTVVFKMMQKTQNKLVHWSCYLIITAWNCNHHSISFWEISNVFIIHSRATSRCMFKTLLMTFINIFCA